MINWLILATNVSVIARILLPSFTYNILPTYSPDPFGVFIANETLKPDKIALKALKNEISCICFITARHFKASKLQLTNISRITNTAFHAWLPNKEDLICKNDSCQSFWCAIFLNIETDKPINNNGPKK